MVASRNAGMRRTLSRIPDGFAVLIVECAMCRVDGRRELLQLGDCADSDELGHVDVADSTAALGLVHVVRGDEKGDALAGELEEQIPQRAARHRVDASGGLIQKHNFGRVDDGAGKCKPLLPSAGELAGAAIHVGLDTGQGLQFACAFGGAISGKAVDASIEIHVFGDSEIFVQAKLLRHVSDVPANLGRVFADVHAQDVAGPFRGPQQSAQRLDDRGLAGTVGAEKAEQLALADCKAYVVDRRECAKADRQVIGCDNGGHSRRTIADMPDFRICCALST